MMLLQRLAQQGATQRPISQQHAARGVRGPGGRSTARTGGSMRCRAAAAPRPQPAAPVSTPAAPPRPPQEEAAPVVALDPVHACLPSPQPAHFEQHNTVFVEEFRIRGNEAGPDQRANIITIANLLQEVGGNHGVAMWGRSSSGFASMPGMDHLIFVATRMQIRMEAYPMWGDTVRLQTYFAEDGRLTSRRDWLITDASTGKHLGAATSTWVTINTETRKPAKIPPAVKQRFTQLAHDGHTIPTSETRRKLPEFVLPPQLIGPSQLGRRSDMDPNGHINNVAYLAWALEVIPAHTYEGYHLTEVEMDFKAECTAGDVIECCGMPLSQAGSSNGCTQQFLHLLRKGDSGAEVWRARTTWAPVKGASAPSGTGSSSSSSSSSSSKGEVANQSQLSPEKPANGTGGSTSSTGSSTTTSGSGSSAVALG